MKKRILIACGSGIATSTLIANRVRNLCKDNGIDVFIEQVKIVEAVAKSDDFDLVVASTKIPAAVKVPAVSAVSYLTGIGQEKTDAEIIAKLNIAKNG